MFGNHGLGGLPEEGAHGKSPKCLGGNLGDFGEFCKGLFKPLRRCLALAQRERFSKVLKHQVNRFRTICTVCGFVALS